MSLAHRTARDMVATAAHELNGPLTVLIGLVDTLERDPGLTAAQRHELLEAMGRQARHLAAVVADVLQVTNEDGWRAPALVPVPLVEVLPHALEGSALGGTTVRVSVDGEVMADRVGLIRALTNLLTNAHRYGGPQVSVSARADGPWTAITVADDGDGVPETLRASLFDRYTRGDNADGHHGLGIGLRIALELVESFDGSLTYEPARPHGSRFTIHLHTAPHEPVG